MGTRFLFMQIEETQTVNGHLDFVFLFFAAAFHILESFNFDAVYHWLFQLLSIISLCLIIYVNWKKIFSKKKKDEDN